MGQDELANTRADLHTSRLGSDLFKGTGDSGIEPPNLALFSILSAQRYFLSALGM